MSTALDPRLERAKEYLVIAESEDSKREAYIHAAEEIAAVVAEGATQTHVATCVGKSRQEISRLLKWRASGYEAATPWLADKDATTRAARSHARALLTDESETAKLVANLPPEARVALAKAVVGTPAMAEPLRQAEEEKAHVRTVNVTDPKITLLQRIEGDRIRLKHDAELMAGHWHDGRHDTREEELALVRDSMAQAVIEVEQTITTALRGGVEEGVR